MRSIIVVSVLVFSVCAKAVPVDYEDSTQLWEANDFRPPHFSQSMYKATVLDNNNIEIMDGPIVLQNPKDGMYFFVTSDNYEDYSLGMSNATDDQKIELVLTTTAPISREFDVVIIEALDEDLVPVSRTTILVFNFNKDIDMYRMKFKIDDSEYIVLNYFYFKWFLALLTATGLLILVIELHEIVKNIRIAREGRLNKYHELLHI